MQKLIASSLVFLTVAALVLLSSLALQSYRHWQAWQIWRSGVEAEVERDRQQRQSLQWWREHAKSVEQLFKRDQTTGSAKAALWNKLKRRALAQKWVDLSWQPLPSAPRDADVQHWSRQRFRLSARLPHEGDLFSLASAWQQQWGTQLRWSRCVLQRAKNTPIQAQARPLSINCEISLWQWQEASYE